MCNREKEKLRIMLFGGNKKYREIQGTKGSIREKGNEGKGI